MAQLKLIDSQLLMDIIKQCKSAPLGPPIPQNLALYSRSEDTMNDLLDKPASFKNKAAYNTELANQSIYLDKLYRNTDSATQITPQIDNNEITENNGDHLQVDNILQYYAPLVKKRVNILLDRLKSAQSTLSWDSNYRLIDNGRVIENSNILDLIKVVTSPSNKIRATPGLAYFIKSLKKLNIPIFVAGSPKSRKFLTTGTIDRGLDPLLEISSKRKRLDSDIDSDSETFQSLPRLRSRTISRKTPKISIRKGKGIIKEWIS